MNNPDVCQPQRLEALRHIGLASIATLVAILMWAPPASAQLSRVGDNPNLGASPVRGTDTAFDPVNHVYLVVGSTAGNTITPLFGVFTTASGAALTPPFQINNPGQHAHFPRVVYSPDVSNGAGGFGGFLVTWHGGLFTNSVRARVVAYPNRLVSGEAEIPSSTFQEAGPSAAYSPVGQVFLVAWQASDFTVWAALIDRNGQPGAPFQVSEAGQGARDPGVGWNPQSQEFGVLYSGWTTTSAISTFARVNTSGTVLRRNTFNFVAATYITSLAFNSATGRFMAAWSEGGTYGAEIDANGDVVTKGLLSTTTGTYDSLGLAYNPASGTFLLAGQGPSFNVWATELNSRGARTSAEAEVTSAGGPIGSFYPRAAANTTTAEWNISFYHNFGTMGNQVIRTSSSGGGPAGTLGGAVSPPASEGGCPGSAPFPGAVCVNGGWVPGTSGGGSTAGGCATSSPGAGWTCVNGGWVPPASGGGGSTGGCTTPDPFAAIGGGTCINGGWVPGGSGGGSTAGGCATSSPGTGWTCANGGWVPPASGGGGSTGGCTTANPFVAMGGGTCINGGWVPGGSGGGSTAGGCATSSPGTGWTCVNGGWVPPASGGGGSTGGCTTADPFVAMGGGTCTNGGWVPGGTSGGCTTSSPGTGWTCVNGGWLPPASGGSSTGGCTTPDPFAAMGGGTCVNGGWTFGGSGSVSGGCTTPDPFTAMGGGICSNGGWVPKSR